MLVQSVIKKFEGTLFDMTNQYPNDITLFMISFHLLF